MSISTEIERINNSKEILKTKGVELGISVGIEKIDELANQYNGIVNNEKITATVKEGETYTIPKGYHDGTGTVSGVSGGGNYELQSKTITPTKMQQTVTPEEGYYGLSDVKVNAIPNNYQDVSPTTAIADDILSGKIIITSEGQVKGTMQNNGSVTETLDKTNKTYTILKGYHDGTGTVSITTEDKSITPSEDTQTVEATSTKVLGTVTIQPIPSNYKNTSDATSVAEDILSGKTAYANGQKITGTMKNNGNISGSIDGLSQTEYTIPKGYHNGLGKVSLTNSIEEALAAI